MGDVQSGGVDMGIAFPHGRTPVQPIPQYQPIPKRSTFALREGNPARDLEKEKQKEKSKEEERESK